MTNHEIIAANKATALEQVEQDERNAQAKADMKADAFLNRLAPHTPTYFREDTKEDFLAEIVRENIKASQ